MRRGDERLRAAEHLRIDHRCAAVAVAAGDEQALKPRGGHLRPHQVGAGGQRRQGSRDESRLPIELLFRTFILHAACLLRRLDYRSRAHQHACLRRAQMTRRHRSYQECSDRCLVRRPQNDEAVELV